MVCRVYRNSPAEVARDAPPTDRLPGRLSASRSAAVQSFFGLHTAHSPVISYYVILVAAAVLLVTGHACGNPFL